MAEENKIVSADAGSTKTGPDSSGGEGQPDKKPQASNEEMVPKSQYAELEKKLGEQGRELGENRDFIQGISPLLTKLENKPDLVEAILEDKINPEVLEAALKGEVSTKEATTVSQAHEEVKKELGKEGYKQASAQEIEDRISKRVSELIGKTEEKFSKQLIEAEQMREFENRVSTFIANTSDFSKYAPEVEKYLDSHPGLDDIEVAYHAVKGFDLGKKADQDRDAAAGEAAKEVAANAGGGGVQRTKVIDDKSIVDQLIGTPRNPNIF